MDVETILDKKGRQVITARPDQTVAEMARLLVQRGIGAAVVCEPDGGVIGVIGERDIVTSLAERGADALELRVKDVMCADPPVCSPEDTLEEVMSLMTERRTRHVPVVVGGELSGIVSIGDIVKHRLEETQGEVSALREYMWMSW